jgi:acetyl-CoA carboxylase biotin carboxyl carrier protein
VITAPSVGVFWRSPRPGSPPFVEVGQTVAVGDTVCIVEMMKLMNNVVSDVAGTVTAIHVENAAQVEYGAPLISIAPA